MKEKQKHSKGSDQEACGDMHPNLLPLSVGLTLIHWSRDHELLAWSRPGVLWSICRIALLIVGIYRMHFWPMITVCFTQSSNLIAMLLASYFCMVLSVLQGFSFSVSLSCLLLYLSEFHWIPLRFPSAVSSVNKWEEDDSQPFQTLKSMIRPWVIISVTQQE